MTDSEQTPISALADLVRANTEQVQDNTLDSVSVYFFNVRKRADSTLTAEELVTALSKAEHGYYAEIPLERLVQGPSYIELGAWIGDQGNAMALMGLGEILGLWKVITPATLHMPVESHAQLAGSGFVMLAVPKDSLLMSS